MKKPEIIKAAWRIMPYSTEEEKMKQHDGTFGGRCEFFRVMVKFRGARKWQPLLSVPR
jgi:hypothetical protein